MVIDIAIDADKEDIDRIVSELGSDGYYGWIRMTKHDEKKVILKGELWFITNGKAELDKKLVLMYDIPQNFKEAYVVGAFYEKGETFFSTLKSLMKDVDIGSVGSLLSMFFGRGN